VTWTFLTGERVAIRAMKRADKNHAVAWFEGAFPVNADRADTFLREAHTSTWHPDTTYLAIVRPETDEVLGGVVMWTDERRVGWTRITMAPVLEDADRLRGDALRLLIPWWRDEFEFMAVNVDIAADQPETIAAAEELGMIPAVRWRQNVARPDGYVDLLIYQALNTNWGHANA
jgi:RimJ/RimL family protein N-acetyltransferase